MHLKVAIDDDGRLTENFIRDSLKISQVEDFIEAIRNYDLQVGSKLLKRSGLGYVLALCDEIVNSDLKRENSGNEKKTIPDALIQYDNVANLVEAKVGKSKIDVQQLDDHQKKFADGEEIQQHLHISWQTIHSFVEG